MKKRFFPLSAAMLLLAFAACTPRVKSPTVAVDLGIVITRDNGTTYKLYWAESNLCESGLCANPEDYGDYFAWGETEPYYESGYAQSDSPVWKSGKGEGYYWQSYKWCDGSFDTLTKYNNDSSYGKVDNKAVLGLKDDAAHVKLGGKWRLPTQDEWGELMNNCTWTWTTRNGVSGHTVTGPNGNSIFLPAAGYRGDEDLHSVGENGSYWSSSLSKVEPSCAVGILFRSNGPFAGSIDRHRGFSFRPVRPK